MIPSIVIAKGNSIRLPHKNLLPFCGLPLVEWSIIQSSVANLVDEVFVSTDSEEIAEIGRKHNATIIWRPKEILGKDINANIVICHTIKEIEKKYDFETFVLMLPTAPCRHPEDTDNIVKAYDEYGKTIGIIKAMHNPRETAVREIMSWRKKGKFCATRIWNKNYRYLVNIYIIEMHNKLKFKSWTKANPLMDSEIDLRREADNCDGELMAYIPTDWYQQYDIDDQDDFEMCEILMERYILKGRGAQVYYDYKEVK